MSRSIKRWQVSLFSSILSPVTPPSARSLLMRRLDLSRTTFQPVSSSSFLGFLFTFSFEFFFCFLVGKCRRLVSFCSLSLFAFSQSVHLHAAEWTARSIVATFSLSVCVPSLFFSNWKNLRQRKKKRLRSSGLVYIISNRPRTCESSASTRPRTDGDWRERESRTFQHIPPFFSPLSVSRIIYRDYM